jgi:chorismate mutase/prephenate dehydratase
LKDQCSRFLRQSDLEGVKLVPVGSTAEAAKKALKEKGAAAVCSRMAAISLGLPVLFESIQDKTENKTRFVTLGLGKVAPTGKDKTSVIAETRNTKGKLAHLLKVFETNNINLTKIESRPTKESDFSVYFYIDFEGHIDTPKITNLIKEHKIKWLGSYPIDNSQFTIHNSQLFSSL